MPRASLVPCFAPIILCLFASWASASQEPATDPRLSTADIASARTDSVVTLRTPNGIGSGVIVDPSGVIVTSLHVIQGETQVSVTLANGDIFDEVSVVDVDVRKDLVILKIKAFGLLPAPLANSDQVRVGDRVVVVGSPRGLSHSVSDGIVSAIRDSGEGYRLIQTTAAASPGSSGGAMFNDSGRLVGIVSSKLTSAENVNFALPINYARALISTDAGMPLSDFAGRFPSDDVLLSWGAPSSGPSGTDDRSAQLTQVLNASGMAFQAAGESWTVRYQGDNVDEIAVYVSLYDDLVLSQAIVADVQGLTLDQATGLLELNYAVDLAKVSLKDDAIVALNEVALRTLDGAQLEAIVLAVAALADVAAGVVTTGPAIESAPPLAATRTLPARRSAIGPGGPSGRALIGRPRSDREMITIDLLQGQAVLRYDATDWIPESIDEGPSVHQLRHRSGDAYIKVISERVMIPIENMEELVLSNARSAASDVQLIRRGTRPVNDVTMRFMEYTGTTAGIPAWYYSHYYSDSSGTLQVIGFTSQNLADEYRPTIEDALSGLTIDPVQ